MIVLVALTLALLTAFIVVGDADPKRASNPHKDTLEYAEEGGNEFVIDEDPSPILEGMSVEHVAQGLPSVALARLVGGIALSGLAVGLVIVAVAKTIGLLLKHFAAGS